MTSVRNTAIAAHLAYACVLAGAVGIAGWQGHRAVGFDRQQPVSDGSLQRSYESGFAAALPSRGLSVEAFAALKLALFGELAEGAVMGRDGWLFTAEEFSPPQDDFDLGAELTQARAVLDPLGVKLLPVILPDKARIHADQLPRHRSAPYEDRFAAAQALLRAEGYEVVNTIDALTKTGFMRSDTHWSPAGARAVAAAIAAHLAPGDHGETGAFETQQTGDQPFRGDLTRFADTGRFARWTSLKPEQIAQFETQSMAEMDLFGDTRIPVVLVGTSFSARQAFHFEGFLKSALGRDVLNMAEVGQGPFRPMQGFLTSDVLKNSPPEIVIWEIPERYLSLDLSLNSIAKDL